jgi:predicted acylesterase/phospholipase RssA
MRYATYAEMLIQSAANCQDGGKLAFYIRARLTAVRANACIPALFMATEHP